MSKKQIRVYVTARAGRRVHGLGSREYGDYFEVEKAVADQLLSMPGYSTDDPTSPVKPAKADEPKPTESKEG